MAELLHRIVSGEVWAQAADPWPGMPYDQADGFVHLSAPAQVAGTLAAHFAGAQGLLLLTIDPARLPPGALRWETSRGGEAFPHLYAPLPHSAVVQAEPVDAPQASPG